MNMSSDSTNTIDPLGWISAERQVVNNFAAANAQAVSDLNGVIAEFQQEIQAETQAEVQFTNDLASLMGVVSPVSITQTLQDLSTADTSIDAAFAQLQSKILQNNQAAVNLASQVSAQSPIIQQIGQSRAAVQSKIAGYKSVIGTFRSFGAGSVAAASVQQPPIATTDPASVGGVSS